MIIICVDALMPVISNIILGSHVPSFSFPAKDNSNLSHFDAATSCTRLKLPRHRVRQFLNDEAYPY
jgi:hypothetical protein